MRTVEQVVAEIDAAIAGTGPLSACFRGHEQTPENSSVYVWNGKERRRCKVCAAMRARIRRAERTAQQ